MNREARYRKLRRLKPRIFIGSAEGSPSRILGRNLEDDRRRGLESIMRKRVERAEANHD